MACGNENYESVEILLVNILLSILFRKSRDEVCSHEFLEHPVQVKQFVNKKQLSNIWVCLLQNK
jgi:hypothetical protein